MARHACSMSAKPDSDLLIVPMTEADWPGVEAIYAEGIATGHATIETEPPTWDAFDNARLPDHRLIARDPTGAVLGWVVVSQVSTRAAYAGVVEHAVAVAKSAQGRGIGRRLLDELVASTEKAGIWTIQSAIFPENTASMALHRAAGFRVVGTRQRVVKMTSGPLAGTWRDLIAIERRSERIGV
jgi:L-amino acid N-acyltransferase YncA